MRSCRGHRAARPGAAFDLLRNEIYGHLDEAEFLSSKWQDWSERDVEVARALIPDLVLVIRVVTAEHEALSSGTCRSCGAFWPCPVVGTVHRLVTDPATQFATLTHHP